MSQDLVDLRNKKEIPPFHPLLSPFQLFIVMTGIQGRGDVVGNP